MPPNPNESDPATGSTGDGSSENGSNGNEPITDGSNGDESYDDSSTDRDVSITHANADDVDEVLDQWIDLAGEQRAYGSHVRPEQNRGAIREVLAAHRVGDGLLVARRDGELLGFASCSVERGVLDLDATRGVLSNLYVKPAARDEGVGSSLLAAVEAELADRGVDVVALEAMADNDAARRFYRRQGYAAHRVSMERTLEVAENDTHSKDDA